MRYALPVILLLPAIAQTANESRIAPYTEKPRYWQYNGEPLLLLGGSNDDSLFQVPDLETYLDELLTAGINYVRNTMSSRQDFGYELYPFKRLEDGNYDLEQWNDAYWQRFDQFLRWCEARDIIVQIEVWDRFDYSQEHWLASPWRPANNVNYTAQDSALANAYEQPAWRDRQPFFHTVPGMPLYRAELDRIRNFQERFVDKMLSYTLDRPNVLYCMNNETSTPVGWGESWMRRIHDRANEHGVNVYVTDMFDDGYQPHRSQKIQHAIGHPEIYSFIDLSQVNSRVFNEDHWDRFMWAVRQLDESPRPLNHTKIYSDGSTSWGSGTPQDGVERFWRNLIAGAAACRFHRPGAGIGSNDTAKACIAAARKLETIVNLWEASPRQDLLENREPDEVYVTVTSTGDHVLYFTDGGEVTLRLSHPAENLSLRWISIATGQWAETETIQPADELTIKAPTPGGWLAVVTGARPGSSHAQRVLRRVP